MRKKSWSSLCCRGEGDPGRGGCTLASWLHAARQALRRWGAPDRQHAIRTLPHQLRKQQADLIKVLLLIIDIAVNLDSNLSFK